MRDHGRAEHDPTGLRAEHNRSRYRPLPGGVAIRFDASVTVRERRLIELAATVTATRVVWSEAAAEPAERFAARLAGLGVDRLRLLGERADVDHDVRRAAHARGIAVDDAPPVGAAEVELPRWLREQSVTVTAHRHGRISRDTVGR
jgi:hypothetical protein